MDYNSCFSGSGDSVRAMWTDPQVRDVGGRQLKSPLVQLGLGDQLMTDRDPLDTAWHIHSALSDWTAKVDAKASFALALESAALAAITTLTGDGRRLDGLSGSTEVLFFSLGLVLLLASMLASVWVVRPRLRQNQAGEEARNNFIYFGHLRHWDANTLSSHLAHDDPLPVLSRQLVVMSKIAWQKHLAVQWSMQLAVAGGSCVAVAYVFAA
jgi:Family of unknown function (DUF5706)